MPQPEPAPRRRFRHGAPILLFLAAAWGCQSPQRDPLAEATPYTPPVPEEPDAIGFFLADFDASLRAWTRLELTASSEVDERRLRTLEQDMWRRASERVDELIDVLQFGAPKNREVAAAALGFSGQPSAQGPLLAALSDSEPVVVQHALLRLGLLALPDTPCAQICYHLRNHPDPWTRNNAAFALQRIVQAGGRAEGVLEACREGLYDPEPGVRAQTAACLGLLVDTESLTPLGDKLFDDTPLVVGAAAASLSRIAREKLEHKGVVARLLADALDRVDPAQRRSLIHQLERLSGLDLGTEARDWKEWAYRLP
jgi:hypothetical protein